MITPPHEPAALRNEPRHILAGSPAQLDQDLAARLVALSLPENTHDECVESVGSSAVEGAVWVALAVLIWVIAAAWSLRL